MQVRRLIYISFYDYPGNTDDLISFPAANAKILYILSLLERLNYCVSMISLCTPRKGFFWLGRSKTVSDSVRLFYFPSFAQGGRVVNALSLYLKKFFLFFYLLFFAKSDDLVLVYHSLAYADVVSFARKLKSFKLILQVEEVYQDVVRCGRYKCLSEYAVFAKADSFLFPVGLLNDKLNHTGRPFLVIHGSYSTFRSDFSFFSDGLIHVIYAGTFDFRKGGAEAAVRSALFLDNRFCIHILGFGSQSEINRVERLVEDVRSKTNARIVYEGLLLGVHYSEFLNKCQIGLSTQNPDEKFNNSSFPSKILSYMGHGVRVVTVRIPAVEFSAVSEDVVYARSGAPEDIAQGILDCVTTFQVDPRLVIDGLDKSTLVSFSEFLQSTIRL